MIRSLRDRATFARLRRSGRRVDRGPVSVRFLPDPGGEEIAVAYAVGRKVGGAVVRNRLRRRLRSIVAEAAVAPTGLAAGAYLVSVSPAGSELTYQELRATVASTMRAISQREPA